jgi:hypothetical protein
VDAPKYSLPLAPSVAHWVNDLDEDAREFFEERAAVFEFDAGMSRANAEVAARAATENYLTERGLPPALSQRSLKSRK